MIKMTIEVTPEQAIKIAALLAEPKTVSTATPVQQTPVQATPVAQPVPVMPVSAPGSVTAPTPIPTVPAPVPVQAAPVPTAPAAPAPVPVQTTPAPVPAPVPTAVKEYSMDELSLASRPIVEAGRQQELLNLLHSFTFTDANGVVKNVQSIREMPKELYPAFANGIRQLGGRI